MGLYLLLRDAVRNKWVEAQIGLVLGLAPWKYLLGGSNDDEYWLSTYYVSGSVVAVSHTLSHHF